MEANPPTSKVFPLHLLKPHQALRVGYAIAAASRHPLGKDSPVLMMLLARIAAACGTLRFDSVQEIADKLGVHEKSLIRLHREQREPWPLFHVEYSRRDGLVYTLSGQVTRMLPKVPALHVM